MAEPAVAEPAVAWGEPAVAEEVSYLVLVLQCENYYCEAILLQQLRMHLGRLAIAKTPLRLVALVGYPCFLD